MRKLLVLVALIAVGLTASPVMALADPDAIEIQNVYVYEDTAEDGDAFYLATYRLEYSVLPSENANEGWLARLIDVGGAGQLASSNIGITEDVPDSGYTLGAFGFYFEAAPVATGTLTAYLSGNPSLSPTPSGITTTSIVPRDTSQLPSDLREQAQSLENTWGVDLLQASTDGNLRFTIAGEHYYTTVIPGIRAIAPDLFVFSNVPQDTFEHTTDTAYTTHREGIFAGTLAPGAIADLQVALGVSEAIARFVIALILTAIILGITGGGLAAMGLAGGQVSGTALFSVMLFIGWTSFMAMFLLGFLNIQTFGIVTLFAAIAGGVGIFMARGSA